MHDGLELSAMKMTSKRWGALRHTQLPSYIIQKGAISLSRSSLAVIAVLEYMFKIQQRYRFGNHEATVRISQAKLGERTGLSRRTLSTAIKTLTEAEYIEVRPGRTLKRKAGLGASEYVLLGPDTGIALNATGRNAMYENRLPYFTIPSVVIMRSAERWSLASMTGSEWLLYAAILWTADVERSNEFQRSPVALRKVSGLCLETFRKALDGLEDRGLIYVTGRKELTVQVCDPFTGEPLQVPEEDRDDPANYSTTDTKGHTRRLVINNWAPEGVESLVRSLVADEESITMQSSGDMMILCPFHEEGTPSCSVSPRKKCFNCFGCGEHGGLMKLVSRLTGGSKADTIRLIAGAMGQTAEYRDPDSKAIEIYSYRDSKGNLIKQVLRYSNDEHGNKVIRQRRVGANGWDWSVKGLPPLLYNREWVDFADTICIVEGEKDADSLTKLELTSSRGGSIIAVTSGGAGTWDPSLAKLLSGPKSRIVLIPDDDSAGAGYATDVAASLDAEGIQYRTVSLAGTGCKDVTEFLETHPSKELELMIRDCWEDPVVYEPEVYGALTPEITI